MSHIDVGTPAPDPSADPWPGVLAALREAAEADAWDRLVMATGAAGDLGRHWFDLTAEAAKRGLLERWLDHLRTAAAEPARAPSASLHLAFALHQVERHLEAHDAMRARCRVLPHPSSDDWALAVIYGLIARRWADTLEDMEMLERRLGTSPPDPQDGPWLRVHQAICLGNLGRHEDAAERLAGLAAPLPGAHDYGVVSGEAIKAWLLVLQTEDRDELLVQAAELTQGWDLVPEEQRDLLLAQLAALLRLGRHEALAAPVARLRALADSAPAPGLTAFFDAYAREAVGDPEGALAQAHTALAATGDERPPPVHCALMRLVAARASNALGRPQECIDELHELTAPAHEPTLLAEAGFQRARAHAALGQHQAVLDTLAQATPEMHRAHRPLAHWLRANALTALQKLQEAHAEFVQAAELGATPADRATAWLQAARTAEASGLVAEAEQAASRALNAAAEGLHDRPDDAGLLANWGAAQFHLAQCAFRRRDGETTLAALEAVRSRAPEVTRAVMWQVMHIESLLLLERGAAALAAAQAALALPPLQRHPYLLNHVAEAALRLGQGAVALEARRDGAALLPEALDHDPLAHLGQAACRTALADLGGAEAALERTLEIDPQFERNLMLRTVRMSCRLGQPENPHAEEDLALVEQLLGDSSLAGPPAQRIILRQAQGLLLNQLERWAEAEAVFAEVADAAQAVGTPPGLDVMAQLMRARALLKLDRAAHAREALAAADGLHAQGVLGLTIQGMARLTLSILVASGEREEDALRIAERAQDAFDGAAAAAGDGPGRTAIQTMTQECLRWQARLLRRLQRPQEALARLGSQLKDPPPAHPSPGEAEAMAQRAFCLADLHDWPSTLAATRRLREWLHAGSATAAPGERDLENDLLEAEAHLHLRAWPHAEVTLMAALQRHGNAIAERAAFWWRLGRAYAGQERWPPARQALRRAEGLLAAQTDEWLQALRQDVAAQLSVTLLRCAEPAAALAVLEDARRLATPSAEMHFNRGVALLDLYRRDAREDLLENARAAFDAARQAGQPDAGAVARQIEKREARQGGWHEYWFGPGTGAGRRLVGGLLSLAALSMIFAPLGLALAQGRALEWTWLAPPTAATIVLLLLPGMRNLSLSWGDAKFSAEPSGEEATKAPAIPATPPTVAGAGDFMRDIDRLFNEWAPSLVAINPHDLAVHWAADLHGVAAKDGVFWAAGTRYGGSEKA